MENKHLLKMKIINQYGTRRIYPACFRSELFSLLGRDKDIKKRTILFEDIPYILALGYAITFEGDLPEDHEKIKEQCDNFKKDRESDKTS